jgi:hypothetical protein
MAAADWAKRSRFAEAYAECGNATQAAMHAGVPKPSAHSMGYRWLRDPQVTEMVRDAMNDRLKALGPAALGVVQEVLLSPTVSPQLRLQAARDVLDRLGWVPPKRPEPVTNTGPRDLTECSLEELETMVSGSPYVRLDNESLMKLSGQA